MHVAHRGIIPPGVAWKRGRQLYASTGLQGVKRQRLCNLAQAKSRRRSTQGVVSPNETEEPKTEPLKTNGAKPDWVRYCLRSETLLPFVTARQSATQLRTGSLRKMPKKMRTLLLY